VVLQHTTYFVTGLGFNGPVTTQGEFVQEIVYETKMVKFQ